MVIDIIRRTRVMAYCLSSILCFLLFITISCQFVGNQHGTEFSGTIEARTVTISSKVTGDVQTIFQQEGSSVDKGSELMKIDETDYQLQRNQATALLAQTEAAYQLAVKGAREEDRKQAARNVDAAKAALAQAKADFERINTLKNKGSATQKQLDDVTSQLEIREANYEATRQILKKVESGSRQEEIDMALARKDQAAASLAILDKKMGDCTIISPTEGTVTELLVEEGEMVIPGQDVAIIADLSTVTLRIYLPEQQLPNVRIGQNVAVTIDGSNEKFQGTITYISDIAEFTPKTIQTKDERVKLVYAIDIDLENEKGVLKSGMPADAHL